MASTLKEIVMTSQKMWETMVARLPTASVKEAFPKLEVQPFKAFSGNLKDYPGLRHDWVQQIVYHYQDGM